MNYFQKLKAENPEVLKTLGRETGQKNAGRKSPLVGTEYSAINGNAKGENNIHAQAWHIVSPENVHYRFKNMSEFVRTHHHLFDSSDTSERDNNGRKKCSRAAHQLGKLRPTDKKTASKSWKGWTWGC